MSKADQAHSADQLDELRFMALIDMLSHSTMEHSARSQTLKRENKRLTSSRPRGQST